MSDKCSYEGCTKPVFVKKTSAGPLCNGHYRQFKRLIERGQPLSEMKPLREYKPRPRGKGEKSCYATHCSRPTWGRYKYCQSHQRQIWEGVDPKDLKEIREYSFHLNKNCQVENCNEPIKARGFCSQHYSQYRNSQSKEDTKPNDRESAEKA